MRKFYTEIEANQESMQKSFDKLNLLDLRNEHLKLAQKY